MMHYATPHEIAVLYVDLWNEADVLQRRQQIERLFAPDAVHHTPSKTVKGHHALERRVAEAYAKWVAEAEYRFLLVDVATGHHDGLLLNWQMARPDRDDPVSFGTDFMMLNGQGQVVLDYQFIR